MQQQNARVLIVDDSQQDLRIHASTLRNQGYDVVTACGGEEALLLVEMGLPDLFLIDTNMKDMDGYSLCEQIKNDSRLLNVPVVFVTDSRAPEGIARGYEVGGVDYIVKPCHLSEFLARVRTHIHLYRLLKEVERLREIAIDSNPLTHLPGNNTIVSSIQDALDHALDMAVVYTDLDNFKAYNDAYGFTAGDGMLHLNADALKVAMKQVCDGEGFLGHVGGDDFVMILPKDRIQAVADAVITYFDEKVPELYNDQDRQQGCIVSHDRQGKVAKFPFVSISMAGVCLNDHRFTRYVEVAAVCAELKHSAKAVAGSNLFLKQASDDAPVDDDVRHSLDALTPQ